MHRRRIARGHGFALVSQTIQGLLKQLLAKVKIDRAISIREEVRLFIFITVKALRLVLSAQSGRCLFSTVPVVVPLSTHLQVVQTPARLTQQLIDLSLGKGSTMPYADCADAMERVRGILGGTEEGRRADGYHRRRGDLPISMSFPDGKPIALLLGTRVSR